MSQLFVVIMSAGMAAGRKASPVEEIPVEARVVALCDAFDSLTHERPWRSSQSPQIALHTIETDAGTYFDPYSARLFVEWLR